MTFYMLRDKKTGLYYKRIHGRSSPCWVAQKEASVWTTPAGPSACLGVVKRQGFDTEIVTMRTSPPKVTFVDGDDWEGLYLDGTLVEQGHHVRLEDVMKHLGVRYDALYADQEWLEARGRLPENLEDVETA